MTPFLGAAAVLVLLTVALLTRSLWRTTATKSVIAGVAGFVVFVAAGGYAWVGTPQALLAERRAPSPVTPEQVEALVKDLAARLQQQPDDGEGWIMLARSYAALERHAEAVPAFQRALPLRPRDAGLLADYASSLAMAGGRGFSGEPSRLIEQALTLDPDNPQVLALAGTAAFTRSDFAAALRHWERMVQLAPNSGYAKQLQPGIDAARQRLAASAMAAANTAAASAPGPANASLSGELRLAPTLAARAAPDDTVFIFARAVDGPRMPLAILRKQVKDLPLRFTLDDGLAMSPTAKLSSASRVLVGARVSKSGDPMPQAGDLQGWSAPVAPGASGLTVEINEVVGP